MSEDVYKAILRNLNKAIACNPNVKQKDIAEALSVAPSSVSGWLSGAHRIDILHLVQLCQLLGVSIDAIVSITEVVQSVEFTTLASQLSDRDRETVLALMKIMAEQNRKGEEV